MGNVHANRKKLKKKQIIRETVTVPYRTVRNCTLQTCSALYLTQLFSTVPHRPVEHCTFQDCPVGTESRSDKCVPSSEKIFSTFVPRWFLPRRPKNRRKSRQAPPEDASNWPIFWLVIPGCNGSSVTRTVSSTFIHFQPFS